MKIVSSVLFLIFTGLSFNSFAFVENATHGYSNCMACHYSPAGGDLLNEYGRSLSSALMSTWSLPGAERALGGAVPETKWAKFGGDLRTLQSYVNSPRSSDQNLFLMQNNVEIGLKHKNVMLIGTLGTREGPDSRSRNTPDKGEFLSERHYVLVEASSTSRIRAGKFRINYGINDPNHFRPYKNLLGFGSQSERYNLEYSKFFDSSDLFVTYSLGRIDDRDSRHDERSFSTKFSHYLGGKSKVGVNYLYGEQGDTERHLVGAFGITPITEKSYVLYELDYQSSENKFSGSSRSVVGHFRLGYEAFKGFKAYTLYDQIEVLGRNDSSTMAPGLGFQWLPFPHLELQVEWQSITTEGGPSTNRALALFHVYY